MEHPRSVSQDAQVASRHSGGGGGGGSLASACLAAPAVPVLHLAWGYRVIVAHHCFLLSFISLPAVGLRPVQLGQGGTQSWTVSTGLHTVLAGSGTLTVG